jgi:membrane associated rhomboid family serine protease
VVVVLLQPFLPQSWIFQGLSLVPHQVMTKGMVWELATYMFLHGGIMHILMNMFMLVIFGSDLERWWGSRPFLKYYFITGIGAGVIHIVSAYFLGGNPRIPVIGASGAIFGVMVAFAMTFPNRTVLLFPFMIPVSARTMVIIAAVIQLMAIAGSAGDGVARFAHLGGMLVGYLYLRHGQLLPRVRNFLNQARSSTRPRSHRSPEEEEELRNRVNEILDKANRHPNGIASLTDEEREVLHEARRRRSQGND